MENPDNQFIYKDKDTTRPRGLILLVSSGLFLLLIKYNVFSLGDFMGSGIEKIWWFFLAASSLMILFSSGLTVIANKSSRILQLRYRYLLLQRTKDIPFDDIADIQSQSGSGSNKLPSNLKTNSAGKSGSRLVAVLKDGTKIPFRRSFTPYVNNNEVAADLRFAVIGSRQPDIFKVKSPDFTLPIRITFAWWVKAIYILDIILFGVFAVFSFDDTVLVSIEFAFFVLLGIYGLITSRTTIEVDQTAITLLSPPYGIYRMYLRDIQSIEINEYGTVFVFIGDDKHLIVSLGDKGNGKREFLAFFSNFVQERQIEVEPIITSKFRQKNTKVS
jgi:hypothetical protein